MIKWRHGTVIINNKESNISGFARPVRTLFNSMFACATACSIRCLTSSRISLIIIILALLEGGAAARLAAERLAQQKALDEELRLAREEEEARIKAEEEAEAEEQRKIED